MHDATIGSPMPRDARIRVIGEGAQQPVRTHSVLFQGRYRDFPVVRVPNDALVYRVENGRLAAELEEQSARHGSSLSGLRERAESRDVQSLLHDLLVAKARDPRGPIYAELENLAQQTEPLLVLFDGTVINGNRRLAAMRQLLAHDSARYAGFASVHVAVLPSDIPPAEVEYVEAALQMAPETKLGYGWIDRRLKLRKQRDELRLPVEQIMAAYRIEDAAEIDRELAQLALAEEYLSDYCGAPGRYSMVADVEVLFAGLHRQLSVLDEIQRHFWQAAGFVLVHGRPATEAPERYARLYPFSGAVPRDLPSSGPRRLAVQFGVQAGDGQSEVQLLLTIFRDRHNSKATAQLIADTLDEMRLEDMERRTPERVLRKVRQASQLIARLEPGRLTPAQRRSLRGDLATLEAYANYLLRELKEQPPASDQRLHPERLLRRPYRDIPSRLLRQMVWFRSKRSGSNRRV